MATWAREADQPTAAGRGRRAGAPLFAVAAASLVLVAGCASTPSASPPVTTATTANDGSAADDGSADSADPNADPSADDPSADDGSGGIPDGGDADPGSTEPPALPATKGPNLVVNPSFEADGQYTRTPSGWQTPSDDPKATLAWVGTHGGAYDGAAHLTQFKRTPYETTTNQTIKGLANGTYVAWLFERSGGQADVTFSVIGTGGADPTVAIAVSKSWGLIHLPPFPVTTGQVMISIHTKGEALSWLYIDDVHLHLAG